MEKIYLKDYKAPGFRVKELKLFFNIFSDKTIVDSEIFLEKSGNDPDLFLDGIDLKLLSLTLDNKKTNYDQTKNGLSIKNVPKKFTLKIQVEIYPHKNTILQGLYKSGSLFVTQCESQGFRHITYFMDRPDVMTTYTVTIEADKNLNPIMLSNGDRSKYEDLGNGRHKATWKDPFKKPSYLFALVAGDLGVIKDSFTTVSGKKVALEIYAPHEKLGRCHHAMNSLKKSMKWDEDRFGREYDLSTFMIVSTDDFNAGAMENKGLNIFNSKLILADPKTATDDDYARIEAVIGHEYFHNWTGNRITLRDWFHLSLKEGLTVYRDQEFSMDLSSRDIIRIEKVNDLRDRQFPEDAGPNAHPIRPESGYSVDNFYTSTIYEKGAEIIRMMQTMVGRPGFRKGMDNYFNKFDGQAVIIEDFANTISETNNQDWSQFKRWYSQAGTPHVAVQEFYDATKKEYTLELSQETPLTSQEKIDGFKKMPFDIPLVIGLLDSKGNEMALEAGSESTKIDINSEGQSLIHLNEKSKKFVFKNVLEKPFLSLNRGFSAPIYLDWSPEPSTPLFLMTHDKDAFNRYEASQKIYSEAFKDLIPGGASSYQTKFPPSLNFAKEAFHKVVSDSNMDVALKEKLISLPSIDYVLQTLDVFDPVSFKKAHDFLVFELQGSSEKELLEIYKAHHGVRTMSLDHQDFSKRRLKNRALSYLSSNSKYEDLVWEQFSKSDIMTDQQSSFQMLLRMNSSKRTNAIDSFYEQWKKEYLVLTKWFALQATADHPDTFKTVVTLSEHKDFNIKNPNLVYSLIAGFGRNLLQFHNPKNDSYVFMADKLIEVDKLNPHVAARCSSCFNVWTKLPKDMGAKVQAQLERMVRAKLSSNTHEIISKALSAQ